MSLAASMRKVSDEIRKSRQDLHSAKKFRLETEGDRQDQGEEERKDREKFVHGLITEDNERLSEAKHLFRERVKQVKGIFNEVNSFLGEVSDDMGEAHRIFSGVSKRSKHFESGNGRSTAKTKHSKSKSKKKRK